jgi:hypothetical protein
MKVVSKRQQMKTSRTSRLFGNYALACVDNDNVRPEDDKSLPKILRSTYCYIAMSIESTVNYG